MGMHMKWQDGQLIYYDDTEQQRLLEAYGPDVCKFLEEFVHVPFASANNMAKWTTTLTGASTVALVDGAVGGNVLITTAAVDADGINCQAKGEPFLLASGKECYFGCRLKVSDATASRLIVGLCITDTTLIAAMSDGIYFNKLAGSTTLSLVLEQDTTTTTANFGAIANDTWYTLEFYFDGTDVAWWVDGAAQTAPVTDNLPDDEYLTPSIAFQTQAGAKTCTVDWVRAIQVNS